MTHLSRSDTDKMFSDMAEHGSADDDEYNQHQYDDDEDYEMSGSGDYRKYQCPIKHQTFLVFRHLFILFVINY
jgi:hypothetical protein